MFNIDKLFRDIELIHNQIQNPENFRNRVAILDEHKNLVFVDANDPRVKNSSINQLDYITSRFKEFASPFKERPYKERQFIGVLASDRDALIEKLHQISETSLQLARQQQSYAKAAKGYLSSFINTKFDPILKAKDDMDKAINRIDECIVGDPKREIFTPIATVVINLRKAAAAASESIAESVNAYQKKDKTVSNAENCLKDVNSALSKLRKAITESGSDIADIQKKCASKKEKKLLEDPTLQIKLRESINEIYDTFASISDSLSGPTELMTRVMSQLRFTIETESVSQMHRNASPEEKTCAYHLGVLKSLIEITDRLKNQNQPKYARLMLYLNQMRIPIKDLEQLEREYPRAIRGTINAANDQIAELKNRIRMEKAKNPPNENAIKQLNEESERCEKKIEERMKALEGVRQMMINHPIFLKANEVIKELDDKLNAEGYAQDNKFENPLSIDLNFWLFEGLTINSYKELLALDQAMDDHNRMMDGMAKCRNNPLSALGQLEEQLFGVASILPASEKKRKKS